MKGAENSASLLFCSPEGLMRYLSGKTASLASLMTLAALLGVPSIARAAFITVGEIDPASTNNVDQSGTHSSHTGAAGTANILSLADFRTRMASAFAVESGGVIDFEVRNDAGGNAVGSVESSTKLRGRYGDNRAQASGFKSVEITSGDGLWTYPGNTANGRTPTSGSRTLGKDVTDVFKLDILAGAVSSPDANEYVSALGFTVLERLGANVGNPLSVTATFSDGSTVTAQANMSGASPASDQDTFFGFIAPSGSSITSVRFNPGNFTSIDDLAFITSSSTGIPEPAGLLLLGGAVFALVRRRRA
jgi:hypothetical protein